MTLLSKAELTWPLRDEAERSLVVPRIAAEASFKSKAYAALKEAVTNLDIYGSSEPIMLAEDKTFPDGLIGFGSFDDSGLIDNIKIWGKKMGKEKAEFFQKK